MGLLTQKINGHLFESHYATSSTNIFCFCIYLCCLFDFVFEFCRINMPTWLVTSLIIFHSRREIRYHLGKKYIDLCNQNTFHREKYFWIVIRFSPHNTFVKCMIIRINENRISNFSSSRTVVKELSQWY